MIADTLKARGAAYGPFIDQAALTVALKNTMRRHKNWEALAPDQKEALEMIQLKIARILSGDPDHFDSWHDIEGYAKLVADRLKP